MVDEKQYGARERAVKGSIHILPTAFSEASGYCSSVSMLCKYLNQAGCSATLAVPAPLEPGMGSGDMVEFRCDFGFGRIGFSSQLKQWLRAQARSGRIGIVHSHSLWRMPNIYPSTTIQDTLSKHVVSPRGTLSPQAGLLHE